MNSTRAQAIEELRRMVLTAVGGHDAAVWLFGSCARGEVRQHSDIDIGILPRDELPPGFFGELEADIKESTIPYDVDLVDLRHADPALIDEVQWEVAGSELTLISLLDACHRVGPGADRRRAR